MTSPDGIAIGLEQLVILTRAAFRHRDGGRRQTRPHIMPNWVRLLTAQILVVW